MPTWLLAVFLFLPALAFAQDDELSERMVVCQTKRLGLVSNLRVQLQNRGQTTEAPRELRLQMRVSERSPWSTLKIWRGRCLVVGPGQKIVLSYLPSGAELSECTYELRTVMWEHGESLTARLQYDLPDASVLARLPRHSAVK